MSRPSTTKAAQTQPSKVCPSARLGSRAGATSQRARWQRARRIRAREEGPRSSSSRYRRRQLKIRFEPALLAGCASSSPVSSTGGRWSCGSCARTPRLGKSPRRSPSPSASALSLAHSGEAASSSPSSLSAPVRSASWWADEELLTVSRRPRAHPSHNRPPHRRTRPLSCAR